MDRHAPRIAPLLALLTAPALARADLPEIVDRAAGSVVGIEVSPNDVRPPALHRFAAGWVFDPNGHVVTSAALVAGAQAVQVRLEDGRRVDARVVGADPTFDVAVLELASHPPAFPLGRSDLARLGESVSAVTRAADGRIVVRAGVLSSRGGLGTPILDDDLQPDLDLDPSFVGAPLLDAAGRVLGMLTLRGAPPPPFGPPPPRRPGPGPLRMAPPFGPRPGPRPSAAPIEAVSETVRQLLERGHVDWPWLGLALQEGPASASGGRVQVVAVEPGSSAAAAGAAVAPGDVLVSIDGRRVRAVADVQRVVLSRRVGQHMSLVIERAGRTSPVDVVTQSRPPR